MTENDLLTPYATTNQHGVKIQDVSIGSIFKVYKVALSVSAIESPDKDSEQFVISFIIETLNVPDGGICETTIVKVKFDDVKPYISDYNILKLNDYSWYELNGNISVMKCGVGIFSGKSISELHLHKLQKWHSLFSENPLKLK